MRTPSLLWTARGLWVLLPLGVGDLLSAAVRDRFARRMAELAERVHGHRPERISLIGMENNHQYVADLIREKMLGRDVL